MTQVKAPPAQPAPATVAPPTFVQRGISLLTLLSLFVVVCSPIVYVGGRAYHDGWYERLHLNPGLFPGDTQSILTYGFIGWTGAFTRTVQALLTSIDHHKLGLIVLLLACFPLFSMLHWGYGKASGITAHRRLLVRLPRLKAVFRWMTPSLKPVLMLLLTLVGSLQLTLGLGLILAFVIEPPLSVGKHDADVQISSNFQGSAEVSIKDPLGKPIRAQLIGCGPQFCALWTSHHASMVPMASITWADSPAPDLSEPDPAKKQPPSPTTPTRSAAQKATSVL